MIQDWEHHELRCQARGAAVAAFANLGHEVAWSAEVLRVSGAR